MEHFELQIRNSIVSLLLVVFILAPSIVKFSHAINEHELLECKEIGKLHFHKIEMDCDFQKFNLSPLIYTPLVVFPENFSVSILINRFSHYSFLSYYQNLHFALRGPPFI